MANGNLLIGTDIGTFGTKSVLVNAEGRILADSFEETDIISLKPLWAEQWPQVWLDAVCKTIQSVLSKAKVDSSEVGGLSISGLYSGSGVPCDKNMKPIRPCLIWMDRRAIEEVEWVKKNIGEKELFKVTGNAVDTYFGFTKMLWLKFKEPKTWERTHQLVTTYGYSTYCLTGEVCVDYSSAGNYGGIFNIHRRDWSEEMMEEMGVPRSFFPEEIVESKNGCWRDNRGRQQSLRFKKRDAGLRGRRGCACSGFKSCMPQGWRSLSDGWYLHMLECYPRRVEADS